MSSDVKPVTSVQAWLANKQYPSSSMTTMPCTEFSAMANASSFTSGKSDDMPAAFMQGITAAQASHFIVAREKRLCPNVRVVPSKHPGEPVAHVECPTLISSDSAWSIVHPMPAERLRRTTAVAALMPNAPPIRQELLMTGVASSPLIS